MDQKQKKFQRSCAWCDLDQKKSYDIITRWEVAQKYVKVVCGTSTVV